MYTSKSRHHLNLTLKSLSQCDAKERELSNLAIIFKKAYYDLTGARKQYFKQ